MIALVIVVWLRMYVERVGQMQRQRIHPQAVASRKAMSERVQDSRAVDNFQNLFEVPILFYLLVVLLLIFNRVDEFYIYLSWAFVGCRIMHSLIHITYNKVMHRFPVYVLSCLLLWFMWIRFAIHLL